MALEHPFTQDDLRAINEALRQVNSLRPFIAQCRDCGLPVDDPERLADHLEKRLTAFKKTFWPREP